MFLQNSQGLHSIHEEKEVARTLSEPQPSTCEHKPTGLLIHNRETTARKFLDNEMTGEDRPHPLSFKDVGGIPTGTTFSQAGCSQDVFTSQSVPNLLSTQDDVSLGPMTHSSSVNPTSTEVGLGWRRVSSAAPHASQPSTSLFSQTVTLSSSDSQSTFNINISISSPESQSQSHGTAAGPYSKQSKSEQHHSLTAEDEEVLKRTVTRKTHIFINNTNFETLIPFLFGKKLVHEGESEMLQGTASHLKKGNHFYTVVLPQKGKRAYRRLYKCLKREQKHLGHGELVQILNNALNNHESPPSSSGSSPTNEENFPDNSKDSDYDHPLDTCANPSSTYGRKSGAYCDNIKSGEGGYSCVHCTSGFSSADYCNPDGGNKIHQHRVNSSFSETTVRDDSLRSDPSNNVRPDGKVPSGNNAGTSNGCCTVL